VDSIYLTATAFEIKCDKDKVSCSVFKVYQPYHITRAQGLRSSRLWSSPLGLKSLTENLEILRF
jgi:hypothetical protein